MVVPDAFEKLPTEEQKKGNEWALANSESVLQEMRGQYDLAGDTIYFCFDEVEDGRVIRLIEHKKPPDDPTQDWYLQNSIIQVALYHSLILRSSKKLLVPSSFSFSTESLDLTGKKFKSVLNFGGVKYEVKPKDPEKILLFYFSKLNASKNYDQSRRFDERWKHKEWDYFKNLIKYSPIKDLK